MADRKGEHLGILEDARRAGFVRVRVNGEVRDLEESIELSKNKRHTIEIVVDRLITEEQGGEGSAGSTSRLADSTSRSWPPA